ncbi:glutaredoxin-like protein NrdH [Ligilactobacillus equi]|uniref:Glutaredoxin-like protein NrdH n=2 Tax=Ligilactobacillus equi TaxID=137357 RepID=V7HXT8_9LACO|nr:glutaredoxin [Ligilactobacillus equi DPC 6820]
MLELYTKDNCIQCKMTKNVLQQLNITYTEHNINNEPEYVDYLKAKGFRSVPVLERDQKPIVAGFRPDLLRGLA